MMVILALGLAGSQVRAVEPSIAFDRDIHPLVQTFCIGCHNPEKHKGDVDLSAFKDESAVIHDPKLWTRILEQVSDSTMPPAKKPQPSADERIRLATWIHDTLTHIDPAMLPKDPGRVTIHRLNRTEYNSTIRDLFGVYNHPADIFPADGGGGGGFDNNADTLFIPLILMERYLGAAGEVLRDASPQRLLVARPSENLQPRDAARKVIEHFGPRIFRRPIENDVVEKYLRIYDRSRDRGESFEDAVRVAIKGMLVSPRFLFRLEDDHEAAEPYAVDDYALASRLSYFIWSSMPDDALRDVAANGTLHQDGVLESQVRRMLADEKSRALAENFGSQWLNFRKLLTTAQPDRGRFPTFTAEVRDAMYEESVMLLDSVLREDQSLLTLIDANYTYLNGPLARHYGIAGVDGETMRRVELHDSNRGGILTLGSVLTVNSYPLRTSPVLRGKWVLESILGSPPPPPPADVPKLPDDDHQADGLTFRQRIEQHRKDPQCAACHARMDPIGFGLENFDPVGRWRKTVAEKPVDAGGTLVTGESFSGPAELKKVLLGKKEQFTANLAEKMLAYALGRGVEYYDQPTLRKIDEALAKNDYHASTLVIEIAKSYPFRYRRNAAAKE